MSDEYLLAAKAIDEAADNLQMEIRKLRTRADMYRRRASRKNKSDRWHRTGPDEFNKLIDGGYSRYGAALLLARKWETPLDSVLQHVFLTVKMADRAKRDMRNDHIVRLRSKGLSNIAIARHSAVVRLNGGERMHPNSIPRIARLTRQKGSPPTRIYKILRT